ncbi:MAG TPA: GGDEF domain-containing protein [Dyella sp.]|uniref:GGDEF domain-containing protein n=1 Tax=Dyella sp. TaxID=1869338 RepID=UPI002D790EDF|nr:GGDEF domain-containing protein [Dyella sp.]HET6552629.1 GGDEF domain-containing protein [Dyella sp.]
MHLDIPTLTFVSLLMGIATAIGFTLLMVVLQRQTVLRIWVLSIWVATIGVTLIGLRTRIPDVLSIVLGNGLLVTSNVLTLKGITSHLNLPLRWRWPATFVIAYAAAMAWLAFVTPDLGTRLVLGSLQAMGFYAAYGYLLLRYSVREIRVSCRVAGMVMLGSALFYLARAFIPLADTTHQNIMLAGTPVAATYVIGILTGMATYFALLLLITERLMVDLRWAARTDGLTGLLNRSAIVAEGRLSLERCAQRGLPFTLLVFDLDHFKQINDSWGHDAGDAVLRHVTVVLREITRWPGHLAARYGGEEFVLALPGANLAQGLEVAERLRRTLAQSHARIERQNIPVTASIGVAMARPGVRFEMLVRQADEAMYRTKFEGRNGVSSAYTDDEPLMEAGDTRC